MPKRKLNGDHLLNSIVSDFANQRPQMTKKQASDLEAALLEKWSGARRAGLESLTVNGRALIKAIAGKRVDAGVAIEKMRLAYALRQYAERLRNFAAVMDSAATRINLAVDGGRTMRSSRRRRGLGLPKQRRSRPPLHSALSQASRTSRPRFCGVFFTLEVPVQCGIYHKCATAPS